MKIDPYSRKYFPYYKQLAEVTALQSVAVRRKVGAIVVLPTGLIGLGWNGMPPGFGNACEHKGKTNPEVIHAERNALDKLTRQGTTAEGSILFVTTCPCMECAKSIAAVGIKHVIYKDKYHSEDGLQFLMQSNVKVSHWSETYNE